MTSSRRGSRIPREAICSETIRSLRRASSSSEGLSFGLCRSSTARSPLPLPPADRAQGRVVGHVEMEGCHGDVSLLDRLEIGSGDILPLEGIAADPVILPSPRVPLLDDRVPVDPLSLPRHPDPPDLLRGGVRGV